MVYFVTVKDQFQLDHTLFQILNNFRRTGDGTVWGIGRTFDRQSGRQTASHFKWTGSRRFSLR